MDEGDHLAARICAGLIDGVASAGVFVFVGSQVGFPPIGFMQSYTPEQQSSYWTIAIWTLAFGFVYSFVCHWMCGGALGKMLVGVRMVSADGGPLSWDQVLIRSAIVYLLAASILAPGPLAAALLGPGSEAISSTLLAVALIGAPMILLVAKKHGRPLHHRLAGVKVIAR